MNHPFSDLACIQVTHKQALSAAGRKFLTKLDFLSLITDGDEPHNVCFFECDAIGVGKSDVALREQLLKAGQTNLSHQFIQVYVSGRVVTPGRTSLLRGKVEFIRFTREGEVDRRLFSYNPNAASTSYKNPIHMAGDIVRVRDSALCASISLLNGVATPFVGVSSTEMG